MILQYYETANSQYHAGHQLPTVQVMVDGNSTYADVQEALKENLAYGHLEEREFRSESHYDAYGKAVDEWFERRIMPIDSLWDESIGVPEDEDEEWDCYAYFVIEEVNEHLVKALIKRPNTCPYCNTNGLMAGKVKAGDDGLTAKVTCMSCDESWTEEHELTGVTFDEDENE